MTTLNLQWFSGGWSSRGDGKVEMVGMVVNLGSMMENAKEMDRQEKELRDVFFDVGMHDSQKASF